jgi:hypothetical protein
MVMIIRLFRFAQSPRGQRTLTVVFGTLAVSFLALAGLPQAGAQAPAATPLPIVIPTLTPTTVKLVTATPTLTPTGPAPGQGRAEAIDKTVGANIRASPDINSEILGKIFPGQFFAIVRRYNKWLQILYDKSPTGLGWVYEDIVNITGIDPAAIPTVDSAGVPTSNVATAAAQQTANYLTATPGAPETATALQASATGVFTRVASGPTDIPTPGERLPTFTFPPTLVEATLSARPAAAADQSGLPPAIPIIVLAGLGLFGLLISALRRL